MSEMNKNLVSLACNIPYLKFKDNDIFYCKHFIDIYDGILYFSDIN